MPYIAALVTITQRSQAGRASPGASKSAHYSIRYELESHRHRRMLSEKLAGSTAGVSDWSAPMWFQEPPESTPASEFWTASRGCVAEILSEWSRRCEQPVRLDCMWQVWPPVAALLCHRSWDCLGWTGGHRSQSILAPPGRAPLASRGDTDGGLSCEKFAELANSLRHWYLQLVRAGVPARDSDDIRCSLAYFSGWAEWADHCERSFDVSGAFFLSRRGGRVVHPLPVLFMAMWTSYKLRADDLLADVSREVRVGAHAEASAHALWDFLGFSAPPPPPILPKRLNKQV